MKLMTGEQRKAANRRNAEKSSGPRSPGGRRRASRNACQHGLTVVLPSSAEQARRIEKLGRKIAGNAADPLVLEHAYAAAQAEFDLAQVRRVRIATINKVLALGRVSESKSDAASRLFARTLPRGLPIGTVLNGEVAPPLPSADRTAEAVRRALPELIKLDRYEQNAVIRRERALRAIYVIRDFNL
jgi:hypothetical protein